MPAAAVMANISGWSWWCSPSSPPTISKPAGTSITLKAMIITPCSTSVNTADTSPPAIT